LLQYLCLYGAIGNAKKIHNFIKESRLFLTSGAPCASILHSQYGDVIVKRKGIRLLSQRVYFFFSVGQYGFFYALK